MPIATQDAVVFKYSDDKKRLLTQDGRVFARRDGTAEPFKLAMVPDAIDVLDEEQKKICIRVRVCVGQDDKGKCTGWSWEVVCEIPIE